MVPCLEEALVVGEDTEGKGISQEHHRMKMCEIHCPGAEPHIKVQGVPLPQKNKGVNAMLARHPARDTLDYSI